MRRSNVKPVLIAACLLLIVFQGARSQEEQSQNTPLLGHSTFLVRKLISYIPYRDRHVALYEGLDNSQEKQYFCTPVPFLQAQTVQYEYVTVKRHHVVTFDIIMWNDHIKQVVFDYMNKEMNITVEKRQIKPVPYEQLLLACDTAVDSCKCPKKWRPYEMLNVVQFSMFCPSKSEAMTLVDTFQNDAKQLRSLFKMMFSSALKKTRDEETVIDVNNIRNGKLLSELALRFPNKNDVLLTADDTERLLFESTAIIMNHIYGEDHEVVNEQSENFIYSMLRKIAIKGPARLNGDSKLWDSVFWDDDSYRPDVLANDLNKSYKVLDNENQEWLVDVTSRSRKNNSEILEPINFLLTLIRDPETSDTSVSNEVIASLNNHSTIVGSADVNESSISSPTEDDDGLRALEENLSNVKWNGTKFLPKAMTFTRINLANLMGDFKDRKVSVSFSSVMLSTSVNIIHNNEGRTYSLSEDLDDKVRHLSDQLLSLSRKVSSSQIAELKQEIADVKSTCKSSQNTLSSLSNSEKRFFDEITQIKNKLTDITNKLNNEHVQCRSRLLDKYELSDDRKEVMRLVKDEVYSDTLRIVAERMGDWNATLSSQFLSKMENIMRDWNNSLSAQFLSREKVHFFAFTYHFDGSNKTVPFSHLDINVGGAFHKDERAFIAPRDGHYAFFFQATVQGSAGFSLSHNGKHIAGCVRNLPEKNNQGPIAMSAVVRLSRRDRVWIFEHPSTTGGTKLYGALNLNVNRGITNKIVHLTTFSGFSVD